MYEALLITLTCVWHSSALPIAFAALTPKVFPFNSKMLTFFVKYKASSISCATKSTLIDQKLSQVKTTCQYSNSQCTRHLEVHYDGSAHAHVPLHGSSRAYLSRAHMCIPQTASWSVQSFLHSSLSAHPCPPHTDTAIWYNFYPHSTMLAWAYATAFPSVCVSHVCSISKWLNISSKFFYHLTAPF